MGKFYRLIERSDFIRFMDMMPYGCIKAGFDYRPYLLVHSCIVRNPQGRHSMVPNELAQGFCHSGGGGDHMHQIYDNNRRAG